MKRIFVVVTLVFTLGFAFAAVPQQAEAAIDIINVSGDCSGATITARFSGSSGLDDTYIAVFTGDYQAFLAETWPPIVIGSDDVVTIDLSWNEQPQGTTILVFVDHFDASAGVFYSDEFTYECGPGVFAPDTADRVKVQLDSRVYGSPSFDNPLGDAPICENNAIVGGMGVCSGQEFPLVGTTTTGGTTWYQIFIGGSSPWVPSTVSYLEAGF